MSSVPGLILANRSYLDHATPRRDDYVPTPGAGGLVAALHSVIESWGPGRGTTWIGAGRGAYDQEWCDTDGFELLDTPRGPLRHRRLFFDQQAWTAHYDTVSNSFLWPLLHLSHLPLPELTGYFPEPVSPSASEWRAYRAVNASFAAAASQEKGAGICWIHDYHLALTPSELRTRLFGGRIGFFLHTPFPDLDLARRYLDSAGLLFFTEWLEGCLGADLVGFQTEGNLVRFELAAMMLCGFAPVRGGLQRGNRFVATGVFPVGIDPLEVDAADDINLPVLQGAQGEGVPLVVGLERCDYTKGIPERLLAVGDAYRAGARFDYVGVAAPTREGVAAYRALGERIERASAEVESAAKQAGGRFLQVREQSDWNGVVSLLRRADVVLTSSLADGMNLVPIQAIVAQSRRPASERGIVFTGEHAGVATVGQRHEGLAAVDPFDREQFSTAIREAVNGRLPRVSDSLISRVRRNDAEAWVDHFLDALGTAVRC